MQSSSSVDESTGLPFRALVSKYREGLLLADNKAIRNLNDIKPLIGLFYINNAGYVGFGLITDINFDVYRNFKYWREEEKENRYWLIRWRIRILWIDEEVRKLLIKYEDYNDSVENELKNAGDKLIINKLLKELGREKLIPRGNICYDDKDIIDIFWNKIIKGLLTDNETNSMIKFYEEFTVLRQFPQSNKLSRGFNKELINELLSEIKGKLHGIDEALLRRFIVSALLGNVMLVGPPGMGKTTLAELLARSVSGDGGYMIKTANSLWFRRDVIGGETIESGSVKWVSGFLIKAYNKAAERLANGYDSPFFLIIDELNRADVDKAFGEFFTIFRSPNPENWELISELVDEVGKWVNSDRADEEASRFMQNYSKYKDEALGKLRVIAIINAVDLRNLFLIGNALVRRFQVIEVKCPSNTTDVEDEVKALRPSIPDNMLNSIIKYINYLRSDRKLRERVCISTGAVLNALHIINGMIQVGELDSNNESTLLTEFNEALKSSLGVISTRILSEIDERLGSFLRQNKGDQQ
ncbi:AAA family ATPase [Caldivirga maquilingensis]|uniref:AAA family ATPase n=1 Tax=Caldivirga maquilingensis TaxID=76887 RepID=UPI00068A2BD3|nr:AAA family ATPase [Caldivirga maquilingensis]